MASKEPRATLVRPLEAVEQQYLGLMRQVAVPVLQLEARYIERPVPHPQHVLGVCVARQHNSALGD